MDEVAELNKEILRLKQALYLAQIGMWHQSIDMYDLRYYDPLKSEVNKCY